MCCECTVSGAANAAVTAAIAAMIILICFHNFPFRLRAHISIASARWLVSVGVCVCFRLPVTSIMSIMLACLHTYSILPALYSIFDFGIVCCVVLCDHDHVTIQVNTLSLHMLPQPPHKPHKKKHLPYNGKSNNNNNSIADVVDGLAKHFGYKFNGPTFPQNQFIFVIWRNRVSSENTHTSRVLKINEI